MAGMFACTQSFLNEVLSLNAQELDLGLDGACHEIGSSMKS